jgi:2-aminoadipate transaminase
VMRSAIEMGLQRDQLKILKTTYAKRKSALSKALRIYLPDSVRYTEPEGGFFIWLVFPEGVDTEKMQAEARRKNVGYLPGIKFSSGRKLKNCARLSFSYFDVPELEEGASRLGLVIKEHMKGQ